MGHYCRICGRERPNEKFSRHGHKIHVCKICKALPKAEREAIEQKDEISGFLHQSHISDKNIKRLQSLEASTNPHIRTLATLVLAIARVRPYKKRRIKILAQQRPDLLQILMETGMIEEHSSDAASEAYMLLEGYSEPDDESNLPF